MLNRNKNKNKYHNPVILSGCEGSMDSSANAFRMTGEGGRSMVEMLGVLAIIGLLSIGGIAGYKNAMNKHRANELLNEASKRAVIVAAQRSLGRSGSIAEFKQPANYTFALTDAQNPNQFNLTITSVDEVVYEKMAELKADNTPLRFIERSGDGVVTLTYNNDMSTTAYASDYRTLEDCRGDGQQGRTWCNAGVCVSGGAENCPANCPNGTTWTGEGNPNTALADKKCQCTDWTTKQCGDNYYCAFSYNATDNKITGAPNTGAPYYQNLSGVCTPVPSSATKDWNFVSDGNTIHMYKYGSMNWWSAYSLCLGAGKQMISLADYGITTASNTSTTVSTMTCMCGTHNTTSDVCTVEDATKGCTADKKCNCWTYLKNLDSSYYWTTNEYGSGGGDVSRFAFYVYSFNSSVDSNLRNYGGYYALCR